MGEIIDIAESLGYPFDSVLCQYNLLDRSNEKMIEYAHSKGVATAAMGPVGGGRLAVPTKLYEKMTGKTNVATYELALRFVLSNPYMDCTLSGMQDINMVNENVGIAEKSGNLMSDEWEKINKSIDNLKKFSEVYCTGCKYCQPCPKGIKINEIFELYTYYNVYELKEYACEKYMEFLEKGNKCAADCINCGKCENSCPQKLSVREKLKIADKTLRGFG